MRDGVWGDIEYCQTFLMWDGLVVFAIVNIFVIVVGIIVLLVRCGTCKERKVPFLLFALIIVVGALFYIKTSYEVYEFFYPRYQPVPQQ